MNGIKTKARAFWDVLTDTSHQTITDHFKLLRISLLLLRHGKWHCGLGKFMFCAGYCWYDGHHAVLHLGPWWIAVEG